MLTLAPATAGATPPGGVPPGQAKKAPAGIPPGLAKKSPAGIPPGQAKHAAGPPGQAKRASHVPPGHAYGLAKAAAGGAKPPGQAKRRAVRRARPYGRAARRARAAARRANRLRAVRRQHRRHVARTVHHAAAPAAAPAAAAPVAAAVPRKRPRAKQRTAIPSKADTTLPATVTRTVRDIVEVVPGWARALILALSALFSLAVVLAAAAARRTRHADRQRTALQEQVGVLQAALLPDVPAALGALAVSAAYRPAAGLAAGGDFYDAFPLEGGRVGILVGDVSGHGRAALAPATFIRHMVRSYLEAGLPPRAALQVAGKVVDEHRSDEFATVVAAVHDPATGTLSYAAAGHPPPIFSGPGAYRPVTAASSPPLGVGSATGLRQTTLPLGPGQTVCLFTDGLVEARCNGGIYGTVRLERAVRELGEDASAQDVLDRVAGETDHFADDVAVCVVRAAAGSALAFTAVEEIEVTDLELRDGRLRGFLEACRLDAREIAGAIDAVAPRVVAGSSCVIRVTMAGPAPRVDVMAPPAVAELPVPVPAAAG